MRNLWKVCSPGDLFFFADPNPNSRKASVRQVLSLLQTIALKPTEVAVTVAIDTIVGGSAGSGGPEAEDSHDGPTVEPPRVQLRVGVVIDKTKAALDHWWVIGGLFLRKS